MGNFPFWVVWQRHFDASRSEIGDKSDTKYIEAFSEPMRVSEGYKASLYASLDSIWYCFSSHHSPDPPQPTQWQIWWQICHRICHRDQNQCISSHKCSVSLSIDCLCYRQSKYIVPIEFGSLHNVYGVIWRRNHPWQICHSFCHVTNVSCEWIWQTEMHRYDNQ